MLIEELKKLETESEPQSIEELFMRSKEGMLLERIKQAVNALLPQMRQSIAEELKSDLIDEIRRQIGAIKVRDGRPGKDGRPGRDGKDAVIDIADLRKKLGLEKLGKKLTVEDIEFLPQVLEDIKRMVQRTAVRRGGGSTLIVANLTSQINGSTKTFNLTRKVGANHILIGTQFPVVYDPASDYSVSGFTLTLGSGVGAPAVGQTLVFIYEEG